MGHEIAFPGSTCYVTHVRQFLKRLAEGFSNNQELPPNMNPVEQRLLQVLRGHQPLFGYALLSELVYDLCRLLDLGHTLEEAPTHLLVDEYQDLTAGELRLIQLMTQTQGVRVNVCGDDRQSIYGFRSADPLALHRFVEVYGIESGDALFRSRRLPKLMCELANKIAEALPDIEGLRRPPLTPWAEDGPEGLIELSQARSVKSEAELIGSRIRAYLRDGRTPDEMIVVACTAQDVVLDDLRQYAEPIAGVSFVSGRKSDPEPTTTELIVRAVSEVRVNAENQMAWRLLVHMRQGLGASRLKRILESDGATYKARVRSVAESDTRANSVVEAVELIQGAKIDDEDVSALRSLILEVSEKLGVTVDDDELQALVTEPQPEDPEVPLPEESPPEPQIVVHTIHSAKGLQAPIVFVSSAVVEAFSGRTDPGDGLRQLIVALTRASEAMYISAPGFIKYTALAGKLGRNSVSLADPIINAATAVGLSVNRLS